MRVSLSGTFSTGKTTLADFVSPLLSQSFGQDFVHIREVARTVIARGFGLDRAATIDSYVVYIQLQLAAEREASRAGHVLSDRSLIDLLAYIRFNNEDLVPAYVREMLEEVVWVERRFFDVYAYLPIEFPAVADGVREVDEDYRAAIDESLQSVFHEFDVAVEPIRGTVEQRTRVLATMFGVTP